MPSAGAIASIFVAARSRAKRLEQLSKRFIHDRIQISFKRALDMGDRLLVSAALDMPYHEESDIAFDFLDGEGRPFDRTST